MENKQLRKLTEEEREKVIRVVNDFLSEEPPEELSELNVLMDKKKEEFTLHLLKDNEPEQIEALMELTNEYIENKDRNGSFAVHFSWAVMYDMWLNKSHVWPVPNNPEWEEWDKLEKIKIKME